MLERYAGRCPQRTSGQINVAPRQCWPLIVLLTSPVLLPPLVCSHCGERRHLLPAPPLGDGDLLAGGGGEPHDCRLNNISWHRAHQLPHHLPGGTVQRWENSVVLQNYAAWHLPLSCTADAPPLSLHFGLPVVLTQTSRWRRSPRVARTWCTSRSRTSRSSRPRARRRRWGARARVAPSRAPSGLARSAHTCATLREGWELAAAVQ